MNLALITPAAEPLMTKSQMRMHARHYAAGADDATPAVDDASLLGFGATAQEWIETATNRALLSSAWEMRLDDWPCGDTIYLPKGKLSAAGLVVRYTPEGGSEQVFPSSRYIVSPGGDKSVGRIVLRNNQIWPTDTLDAADCIRITFTAGWPSAASVPQQITQAALMLVSHFYENREAVVIGNTASAVSKQIEIGVMALLRNWILQPLWNQHD